MIREISDWWHRLEERMQQIQPPRARRIIVAVVGSTILLLGLIMIVLPGPAFIVMPAGLAILALEFSWAKEWMQHLRNAATNVANKVKPSSPKPAQDEAKSGAREAQETLR
jgi:tellurite resistance protein TerC